MNSICEQAAGLEQKRFWRELNTRIHRRRIPFSGSLALTQRCNLDCVHCYARDPGERDSDCSELTTAQWKRIIMEIREAGCLFLVLTGGEPLLRSDFAEIYTLAKQQGFLVTVFTNGTQLGDEILELFHQLPPRLVELSIYGAESGTHDAITGVTGSFRRTLNAVDRLAGLGIPVGLKTILMNRNLEALNAMEAIAADRNVRFRLDAAVFPTLAGDRFPLDLRVSPRDAVAAEFATKERARQWVEYYRQFRDFPNTDKLYNCGAGIRTFHVDPVGRLFPCLMVRDHGYCLTQGSFMDGWNREIAAIADEEADADSPCRECRMQVVCGYCPGFFQLENGNARAPSAYLCKTAELRYQAILSYQEDCKHERESPGKQKKIS